MITKKENQPPARKEGETTLSATPQTDEAERQFFGGHPAIIGLARTLERELSAKQAEVERLSHLNHFWTERYSEMDREKLIDECVARAVCRDADLREKSDMEDDLKALKAAQGWRAISEAPRDGRTMVLLCKGEFAPGQPFKPFCGFFDGRHWTRTDGDSGFSPDWFTPLPTLPVERSENKG